MDPLNLCIALVPVSIYLLVIGRLNLGRRPFLTTGTRDLMALAVAVSGFALVGPIQLFLPQAATDYFGGWIWLPLILLYLFCAVLLSMLTRPRLVVYNITPEHLRPLLENVVSGLDPQRRWAGSSLASPGLGIQLNIEAVPTMRNVQLVAVGGEQDLNGWRQLETALKKAVREMPVPANPRGISFVFLGTLIVLLVAYIMYSQPQQVAQSLQDLLQI